LRALELLVEAPRGPVELSHHLGVTSAASSGIVDRLCARGHARRVPHPSDGRRTQVVITDSAREEVLGHLMPMFTRLQSLDADFTPQEQEVVERYLRAATDAVRVMVR
jgi:DNA-binding MarR family transcriptional regulator